MRFLAVTLFWFASVGAATASDVFIGTLRSPSGSPEAGGHLYRVDSRSAAVTFVGRVMVDGAQPVGLTAMAFHPRTHVLYGITIGINDSTRARLLTIDPSNAEARIVARLSKPLSDISFSPDGRLFGWTANTGQLAVVDITNGNVTTLGETVGAPLGAAFAIDSGGNAYAAPWVAGGRLERVDLAAGTVIPGPAVSGMDPTSLRSMAFSPRGELLAIHSVRTTSFASTLVRIDPATGGTSKVGEIPADSEAIAAEMREPAMDAERLRYGLYGLLVALSVVLAAARFMRRPSRRS